MHRASRRRAARASNRCPFLRAFSISVYGILMFASGPDNQLGYEWTVGAKFGLRGFCLCNSAEQTGVAVVGYSLELRGIGRVVNIHTDESYQGCIFLVPQVPP